jgi:PAS domain-containing protein
MVFSRFLWSILAFVAIIVGTSTLLGIYLQKPEFPVTTSLLVVVLILETIGMILFLTRIRRDLLKLINAMSNDDPTMQFARVGRDPYFSAIHAGFNALIRDFSLVRLDREAEQRFFEETVNHVQFGLLAFNGQGEVKMINRAFLELFGLHALSRLDELSPVSEELPGFFQVLLARKGDPEKNGFAGAIPPPDIPVLRICIARGRVSAWFRCGTSAGKWTRMNWKPGRSC